MSFITTSGVLSANVAQNGTFTVAYPTGLTAGHFAAGVNHAVVVNQNVLTAPSQFGISFGASNITITNRLAGTWLAGSTFTLQAELIGMVQYSDPTTGLSPTNVTQPTLLAVPLGSPATASSTFLAASQSISAAGSAVLAATVLDVPRNVVAAWTTSSNITVTGVDFYGNVMTETATAVTSFTGVKAFARITSIVMSAAVTLFTAGTGVVLGLPVFNPGTTGFVIREIVDGAVASTAGTFVAGLIASASTSTSADVRGTYSPNLAPNSSRAYTLILALPDPGFRGIAQA